MQSYSKGSETVKTKESAAAEKEKSKEPETLETEKETQTEEIKVPTKTVSKETEKQKETETQKKSEATKPKTESKSKVLKNKTKGIALQNASEVSVTTKSELTEALKNDAVQTINIEGNFIYTDALETDKKIVIKSGAVFKWSVYQDTFKVTDMLIENGAVFQISPFDFMSRCQEQWWQAALSIRGICR